MLGADFMKCETNNKLKTNRVFGPVQLQQFCLEHSSLASHGSSRSSSSYRLSCRTTRYHCRSNLQWL